LRAYEVSSRQKYPANNGLARFLGDTLRIVAGQP
jgi:hypothetical protein